METLRQELRNIAEEAANFVPTPGEPFQPDFEGLVWAVLKEFSEELEYIEVKKKRFD